MKICIIGKNSKVANAIKSSKLEHKNKIYYCSQRKKSKIEEVKRSDTIIYLVSDTRTVVDVEEYDRYLNTNCLLLAKFLQENELSKKNFVYISSAKIYNIFNDKKIYNEEISLEEISVYNQIKEIAKDFIALANLKEETMEYDKIHNNIMENFQELPSIDNYFPVYEYSKAISELIISEKLKSGYILRPTYLFGYNEEKNVIYEIISKAFKGETIKITSTTKDFISYNEFINLVDTIIKKKNDNIEIINVCSEKNRKNEELIKFIKKINNMSENKSEIHIYDKCKKEIKASNKKMKKYLNSYIEGESFEREVKQIIYRYYIKNEMDLNIIKEFIGGSHANTYLVEDKNKKKFILKICLGNGAENGNLKLKNEAKQMNSIRETIKDNNHTRVPNIYEMKEIKDCTIIKEEYIKGATYTNILYSKKKVEKLKSKLKSLIYGICEIYGADCKVDNSNMIEEGENRVLRRLEGAKKVPNEVDLFSSFKHYNEININNKTYKNPLFILEQLKKEKNFCDNRIGLCISGDAIPDNIIFQRSKKMIVMDSRGEDLKWINDKPYFSPYYDLGKILFYFCGWSTIRSEKFELKVNRYDLEQSQNYIDMSNDVQRKFDVLKKEALNIFLECKDILKVNEEDEVFLTKIILMAGIHFLSDTFPRMVGKGKDIVKQAYAEYLLGTILINNVYRFINKEIEFSKIL